MFVHLHNHTQDGSLLDGLSKIPELVSKVKSMGMNACAITDHGTAYGLVTFYDECKKQGIKPILGCEFYEAPGSRFDKSSSSNNKYFHLILLVKNETGYKNLCHLVSRSNIDGFYYKPRIDWELLQKYHEGLICLSACIAGRVPKLILSGKAGEAEKTILQYKELFGDDYYLEIQNHGLQEEAMVAQELIKYSRKHNIKLVCTNDTHYVNSEDATAHEWLLCVQTQKIITDPDRLVYHGDYSVKSEDEMRKLFPGLPEAFDNTQEIADKCNFDFVYGDYRMPEVIIPEEFGTDYYGYMESEAWKGFDNRYPEGNKYREQAHEDLIYELSVVKEMGFAEYFLDTRKTIMYARDHGILVGPGRGSAAGSRLCYCLGITDIDPIPYNLLFERFLNPERISMPDIDVDYDYSRKDDVVKSEANSNGWDRFSKIQSFQPMLAKGVIRDCTRVAGFPVFMGDKLAKMIPDKADLKKARSMNPDIDEYLKEHPEMQEVWNIALKLEGTNKSSSTHACGHIPTPVPCEDLYPVSVDTATGYLVCQYNMEQAEHLGNLKKDLLMLRNLTVVSHAHKAVKECYGIEVPLWTEEILNDKAALELISAGNTDGVFQLESDGMKKMLRDLKPSCFEDVIAGIALYRPGPMEFIPDYIKGKRDPASIHYLTPELESILSPTYGQIVYQEQVIMIVRKLAGFSMGRGDLVRKAMGKKRQAIMDEEGEHFVNGDASLGIDGCVKRGISKEIAGKIWDQMSDFAKYAFNKSHAAAYAAITMQTAYLKAHYPEEFEAGLLTSVMDKTEKLTVYLNECKKMNVQILPPDINTSGVSFTATDDGIVYGLASIKGIGEDVITDIIQERSNNGPYSGYLDFFERNPICNKSVAENLIKAGAFDCFEYNRRTMLENRDFVIDALRKEKKNQVENQLSLFDIGIIDNISHRDKFQIRQMEEYDATELLNMEKEATGFYISMHPLDPYMGIMYDRKVSPVSKVLNNADELQDASCVIGGVVTKAKAIFTKDGKRMAFITLEDQYDSIDVVVFSHQYEIYRSLLEEDAILSIEGTLSLTKEEPSFIVSSVNRLSDYKQKIYVRLSSMKDYENHDAWVQSLVRERRGRGVSDSPVAVYFNAEKKLKYIGAVKDTSCVFDALSERFGTENVSFPKQKK